MKVLVAWLALLIAAPVFGQALGGYDNAQVPLAGTERIPAQQGNATVDITPWMLSQYILPPYLQLPNPVGQTGLCLLSNGAVYVLTACPGSATGSQYVQVSSNVTLSDVMPAVLVNAAGGPVTITLPTAVGDFGSLYVKRIDSTSNAVVVATLLGQTIDTSPTFSLGSQYASAQFKSDNANWWVVNYSSSGGGGGGSSGQFMLFPSGQAILFPSGQGVRFP
jgi:hypothetical protein